MAQKNRVQDGTVVYSTNDPATYDLGFNVQGNVNVTKALVVAQSNLSDAKISSSTGTDLELTVQPGATANVRIYPPVDGGSVIINNIAWIDNTPNLGGFIGASSANNLRYYPFVAGNEVSDTLTTSYLNTNYPNIVPGQMVVGSTVVYLNVGLGTWRFMNKFTPAAAQADSVASTVAGLVSDFNSLLAKLRTAGLLLP